MPKLNLPIHERASQKDFLHVTDIPDEKLPNGTASIVTVKSPDGVMIAKCVVDDRGFLRVRDGAYIKREWEVFDDA